MDIRKEAVREYLEDGIPYRTLAKKYNRSRSTINKWLLVHQGFTKFPDRKSIFLIAFNKKCCVKNQNE